MIFGNVLDYSIAVTMLGTWALTVGATFYFVYAFAFVIAALHAFLTGDPRVTYGWVLVAILLVSASTALGLAMLRARRGDSSWLPWMAGIAASFAAFCGAFIAWISAAFILLPLLFGLLGVPRAKNDG